MHPSMIYRLSLSELRLSLREWSSTAFGLALPVCLLIGLGSISGVDRVDPATGRRGIDTWVPSLCVTLAVGMLAWFILPMTLCGYRDRGVLRRLAATPARPAALLAAQLIVNMLFAVVSLGAVFAVAALALGMAAPHNIAGLAMVLFVGILAMFGVGLLLAAIVPSQRAAQGVNWAVFALSAFLAGIDLPIQMLPRWVGQLGGYTPMGAFRFALEDVWVGEGLHPKYLVVFVVTAVVTWFGAVRSFRTD